VRAPGGDVRRFRSWGRAVVASLWTVATLLGNLVTGCKLESEEARRGEAGNVTHAVEALRNAPNESKRPFLTALESTTCRSDDVCALKKTCVEAYSLELGALDALSAVRKDTSGGDSLGTAAVELLGRAEQDLTRSHDLATTCADLEGAARRRYAL
jgi:hypothetical protein